MKKILKIGCLIFVIIPTIFAIVFAVFSDDVESSEMQENKVTEKSNSIINVNPSTKTTDKPTLNYNTLPLKRVGLNSQNRATQIMILYSDSIPSDEIIRRTAIKHWRINSLVKFSEFTAFIYLEGMNTKNTAYAVVEFNSLGDVNLFNINDYSLVGTKWDN